MQQIARKATPDWKTQNEKEKKKQQQTPLTSGWNWAPCSTEKPTYSYKTDWNQTMKTHRNTKKSEQAKAAKSSAITCHHLPLGPNAVMIKLTVWVHSVPSQKMSEIDIPKVPKVPKVSKQHLPREPQLSGAPLPDAPPGDSTGAVRLIQDFLVPQWQIINTYNT